MAEPVRDSELAARLLDVVEHDIVPLTEAGVEKGNKLFGAAILLKRDLSLVVAATNRETENPLWHGEISALNDYFALPVATRPAPADCLFLSTHEPCSLCLSAITWAGFDNFFYLFGYGDTRDAFNIPHDLRILEEVFGIRDGEYRRSNQFWTCRAIGDLIAAIPLQERPALEDRVKALGAVYAGLSATYQAEKKAGGIPLG
jgi:tRNA(Arg) A34 adenosine deaminase TadA